MGELVAANCGRGSHLNQMSSLQIEMKKDYLKRTKRKVEEAKGVVWDDDPSEPGKADRVILVRSASQRLSSSPPI